jgi:hypothetical protein
MPRKQGATWAPAHERPPVPGAAIKLSVRPAPPRGRDLGKDAGRRRFAAGRQQLNCGTDPSLCRVPADMLSRITRSWESHSRRAVVRRGGHPRLLGQQAQLPDR